MRNGFKIVNIGSYFGIICVLMVLLCGCSSSGYLKYSKKLDLVERFKNATVKGKYAFGDANMKWSIMPITVLENMEEIKSIFAHPNSLIIYNIKMPDISSGQTILFKCGAGFHPSVQNWGVSDGVMMAVKIESENEKKTLFKKNIMPKGGTYLLEIPLDEFAGEKIQLKLMTGNEVGKNENGDWAVWYEPKIIIKKQSIHS